MFDFVFDLTPMIGRVVGAAKLRRLKAILGIGLGHIPELMFEGFRILFNILAGGHMRFVRGMGHGVQNAPPRREVSVRYKS